MFFLVMNMALVDVMLGAVSIPLFVYLSVEPYILFHFLDITFSQSSLISAVFISCERCYAIN